MINKVCTDVLSALQDIPDGALIGIGGFDGAGMPEDLIQALIARAPSRLTLVTNNAGFGDTGIAALLKAGLVRRVAEDVRAWHAADRMAAPSVPRGTWGKSRMGMDLSPLCVRANPYGDSFQREKAIDCLLGVSSCAK